MYFSSETPQVENSVVASPFPRAPPLLSGRSSSSTRALLDEEFAMVFGDVSLLPEENTIKLW